MIKIVAIISFFLSLLFVTISFGQNDDPLKKGFYEESNLTPIQRIEKSVKEGVDAIKSGVKKMDDIEDIKIKQAVLSSQQDDLKKDVSRNSLLIEKIVDQLGQISVSLKGVASIVSGVKDDINGWKAILLIIFSGSSGAYFMYLFEKKVNKK